MVRGRPNFVFFLFFGVLFFGRKNPHFRFFSFFGTKMAVKTKKSVLWLSQCTAGRTWVTCSRIQPLSTSPPAVHWYCEAVSTEQSQQGGGGRWESVVSGIQYPIFWFLVLKFACRTYVTEGLTYSEWYSRLKCDHGFIKKYIFFVHMLFHVAIDICKS